MRTLELTENQMWSYYHDDTSIDPCEGLEHIDSTLTMANISSAREEYELIVKKDEVLYKITVTIWGGNNLHAAMSKGPYIAKEVVKREKIVTYYDFVR